MPARSLFRAQLAVKRAIIFADVVIATTIFAISASNLVLPLPTKVLRLSLMHLHHLVHLVTQCQNTYLM